MFKQVYLRKGKKSGSFWGIRLEFLFRGYSVSEMLSIEQDIKDWISKRKREASRSSELKEVQIKRIETRPFKDLLE